MELSFCNAACLIFQYTERVFWTLSPTKANESSAAHQYIAVLTFFYYASVIICSAFFAIFLKCHDDVTVECGVANHGGCSSTPLFHPNAASPLLWASTHWELGILLQYLCKMGSLGIAGSHSCSVVFRKAARSWNYRLLPTKNESSAAATPKWLCVLLYSRGANV